jgi:Holliday junction resolvase RusA-like endonuclease
VTFDLPVPPSTNNLFVTDKRTHKRFPSPAYKAWRKAAGDILGAQYARYGEPAVHKPISLHIRLNVNHQSDIANREKALIDLLVAHLDMPDDCWIDRIVIERDRTVEACVVSIEGASV